MMTLIPKTNLDFISKRWIFFGISLTLMALSFVSFAVKGLNLGLDFTGGTLLQVQFSQPAGIDAVRSALDKAGINGVSLQTFTGRNAYAISVKGKQENVNVIGNKLKDALTAGLSGNAFKVERLEYVGPAVGRDMTKKALWAMILSFFGMIVYIAFRFSNPLWGAMGVIADFHDIIIVVGILSLTGKEIDLVVIAAVLTIAGYSINDTVVTFDRMREHLKLNVRMPLGELINRSINETLSRTMMTTATVFLAILSLYFLGGEVIHNFAFTMLVGCILGTYSTIAIATPLLYEWAEGRNSKKQSQQPEKPQAIAQQQQGYSKKARKNAQNTPV
ncbi:MAG: protein translocase subunit SecF [Elusimicrobiales bacterium]|nr:protein translocase subunit SecF [Elusimicrobiales bacterium]